MLLEQYPNKAQMRHRAMKVNERNELIYPKKVSICISIETYDHEFRNHFHTEGKGRKASRTNQPMIDQTNQPLFFL